jgi:exodeoxyribonuclease III
VTVRLLSYNIRRGGVGRVDALAQVIRACTPDVVVLQEATRPEVVRALAEATGLGEFASRRGRSLAFLSRAAVASHGWRRPLLSQHAFLEIALAGVPLRIVGVHLSAVHAAWTERRRLIELASLLRTVRARPQGFHVLAGDFNTLAPGELLDVRRLPPRLRPFVWLSGGSIRWKTVATVLAAGYVDAWRGLHEDGGGATFPAWDPHLRLDYVFAPEGDAGRIRRCDVVAPAGALEASDHLPLLAELDLGTLTA